jgi:hypothetical protein
MRLLLAAALLAPLTDAHAVKIKLDEACEDPAAADAWDRPVAVVLDRSHSEGGDDPRTFGLIRALVGIPYPIETHKKKSLDLVGHLDRWTRCTLAEADADGLLPGVTGVTVTVERLWIDVYFAGALNLDLTVTLDGPEPWTQRFRADAVGQAAVTTRTLNKPLREALLDVRHDLRDALWASVASLGEQDGR